MTTPLPPWRVIAKDGPMVMIEVDLPDLTTGIVTMFERALNTPAGDAAIRAIVDGRESTKDMLREGP